MCINREVHTQQMHGKQNSIQYNFKFQFPSLFSLLPLPFSKLILLSILQTLSILTWYQSFYAHNLILQWIKKKLLKKTRRSCCYFFSFSLWSLAASFQAKDEDDHLWCFLLSSSCCCYGSIYHLPCQIKVRLLFIRFSEILIIIFFSSSSFDRPLCLSIQFVF